jgi:hypothetical protein
MKSKSHKILSLANEIYGENIIKKIDGFDEAIIGIDVFKKRFIYSTKKCIRILENKMPIEEAIDYFYIEIFGNKKNLKNVFFCEDNIQQINNN